MKILKRGAEAVLYLSDGKLVKERLKKGYRIAQLDEKIRKERTQKEERLLDRARRSGVSVPAVIGRGKYDLGIEWIDGEMVKDTLDGMAREKRFSVYSMIGKEIAKLHSSGIIHGDITTSNMVLKGDKLYIIDFGLGKFSGKAEDQAIDLYVLYEALKAAHFRLLGEAWENVLNAYGQTYSGSAMVLRRLKEIEQRRRYK
ncbi:MAG: Kae1-associated serine/threonine protein kinase [Candidatus Aenigmarchaeota archaeon]|nr:Kae1-associated serine/threonine protein kinase [Candidatus Aenigmarchaeota archaeon]